MPKMTFHKFSLNKQVNQTDLILFYCDYLSFIILQSLTLVLAFWVVAYGSLNCSIIVIQVNHHIPYFWKMFTCFVKI